MFSLLGQLSPSLRVGPVFRRQVHLWLPSATPLSCHYHPRRGRNPCSNGRRNLPSLRRKRRLVSAFRAPPRRGAEVVAATGAEARHSTAPRTGVLPNGPPVARQPPCRQCAGRHSQEPVRHDPHAVIVSPPARVGSGR